jgi:hypothetical protein
LSLCLVRLTLESREMKQEQLYHHLKELAERLGVTVQEHSFRHAGIKVKSGFCRVKGKDFFILDKDLPLYKKNRALGAFLSGMPIDDIFVLPMVREHLERNSGMRNRGSVT